MNKELIKSLAKLAKVNDVESFTKAIMSEKDTELKINFDDLVVRTREEEGVFKENLEEMNKKKHFKDAFEIQIKNLKKDLDLEFEGKDSKVFIDKFKEKIIKDAKIDPSKKIEEKDAIIQKLQEQIELKTSEVQEATSSFEKYKSENKIIGSIPENTLGLSNDVVLSQMRSEGYDAVIEEGKLLATKNGEVLRNEINQNPLSFGDVANEFLTGKNWLKTDKKGRGLGDEGGSETPMNYENFVKQCEKDGINPLGAEAQEKARLLAKDNPEFHN